MNLIFLGKIGRMIVFRIEDDEGRGPYDRYVKFNHDRWSSWSTSIRPGPRDDGIKNFSSEHFFGFSDIDDLTCWFTIKDRKGFRKHKMMVSIYEVDEKNIKKGGKQVAFLKRKSLRVGYMDVYKLAEGGIFIDPKVKEEMDNEENQRRKEKI